MSVRCGVLVGLVVAATLAACSSGSGTTGGTGTQLEIEGVATSGTSFVPPDTSGADSAPPIPDPSEAQEVDISGTLDCDDARPTGTGMFATNAAQVCLALTQHQGVFSTVGVSDDDVCAEVLGGTQHATINGSVNGESVDVSIDRSNSCGIQDWTKLEWLLGPPER